eukprot:gnl/TRDRNA2_/TRDRNA2_35866_c0_seq2.p1 gnl/TRDRNA2_/TRDRNA2_35866_c0~~gnl/TRDRNA2_/TRDRNA2_35866_c0_seq2.p1  ORF type:complete len:192 (+),score=26.66 gnl/TRDRNA2_/TRDRNA2_35866_c0_seq2:115-690(+)
MDDDPMLRLGIPARHQSMKLAETLEGTWIGEGVGEYPPHEARFSFIQELVIEKAIPHGPKEKVWSFRSTSYHKDTKEGLNSESGYLRFHPVAIDNGRLELVCTAPSGLCEVDEGTYNEDSFDVWTRYGGLSRPQSASRPFVTEVRRWCEIRPQNTPISMDYRIEMATERTPMQSYLTSRLKKVPEIKAVAT